MKKQPCIVMHRLFRRVACGFILFLGGMFLNSPVFAVSTPQKVDVIIVGAGIAGLAAAQELNQQGYHILILEAKNRVGGRVSTKNAWGTSAELGGSWLHSSQTNPLMKIIKKENIATLPTQYTLTAPFNKFNSMMIYQGNGQLLPKLEKQKILDLAKQFAAYIDEHQKNFTDKTSYEDAIEKFDAQKNLSAKDRKYLNYFIKDILSFDHGAELNQITAKQPITSEENLGPDVLFDGGGYVQLLEKMVKNTPILLNKRVTEISYSKKSVAVSTASHVYNARYVIVTLPLGVLKADSVKFSPPLPKEKIAAIKKIGFGTYNKTYLLFSKPFWDKKSEWLVFFPTKEQPNELYEVLNYHKFYQQPILLVFTAGDFAKKMETRSDEQIIDQIMHRLRSVYGPSIPQPTSFVISRWGLDPYSRGSYSYPRVGSTEQDIEALAKPVSQRVFFAGEATSKDDYGTVHGAYQSGIDAAKAIIKQQEKAMENIGVTEFDTKTANVISLK